MELVSLNIRTHIVHVHVHAHVANRILLLFLHVPGWPTFSAKSISARPLPQSLANVT